MCTENNTIVRPRNAVGRYLPALSRYRTKPPPPPPPSPPSRPTGARSGAGPGKRRRGLWAEPLLLGPPSGALPTTGHACVCAFVRAYVPPAAIQPACSNSSSFMPVFSNFTAALWPHAMLRCEEPIRVNQEGLGNTASLCQDTIPPEYRRFRQDVPNLCTVTLMADSEEPNSLAKAVRVAQFILFPFCLAWILKISPCVRLLNA